MAKHYNIEYLYAGPSLSTIFPRLIDLKGIQDDFMRKHGSDYFETAGVRHASKASMPPEQERIPWL